MDVKQSYEQQRQIFGTAVYLSFAMLLLRIMIQYKLFRQDSNLHISIRQTDFNVILQRKKIILKRLL